MAPILLQHLSNGGFPECRPACARGTDAAAGIEFDRPVGYHDAVGEREPRHPHDAWRRTCHPYSQPAAMGHPSSGGGFSCNPGPGVAHEVGGLYHQRGGGVGDGREHLRITHVFCRAGCRRSCAAMGDVDTRVTTQLQACHTQAQAPVSTPSCCPFSHWC